jgi:hypothetical protein
MIRAEHIEEELNKWPEQWESEPTPEGLRILAYIKSVWSAVEREYLEEQRRENCLRALWILGFELTRDILLSPRLPEKISVQNRAQPIIEEEGPLLFAFYSDNDQERFSTACRDIELALRRQNLWGATSN